MFNRLTKNKKGQREEELPQDHDGLPDSNTPYGLCPRCNKQSSFDILGSLPATFDSGYIVSQGGQNRRTLIDQVTSMECRNCHQPVIVIEQEYVGDSPSNKKHGIEAPAPKIRTLFIFFLNIFKHFLSAVSF